MHETLVLARTEQLSIHDAAHLELALRRGIPLVILDGDLAKAAKRTGVTVVP